MVACAALSSGCDTLLGLALTNLQIGDGNNDKAHVVEWKDERAVLLDSVYPFGDFDPYDLGGLPRGGKIRFELDPKLLKAGLLVVNADTREVLDGFDGNTPGRTTFEFIARSDVPHLNLYVGPGHTRLPVIETVPFPVHGVYQLTLHRQATGGAAAPLARRQTVVLDFAGGIDTHYLGRPLTIAPFRAADYNSAIAGTEAEVINAAKEEAARIYAEYDLELLTSDDPPPAGPASRVYVSAPGFFVVAGTSIAGGQVSYIDFGNRDSQDVAIVSTSPTSRPDAAALGKRLGKLAAHEIGHLLGLLHQQDGLMSYGTQTKLVPGPLMGFFGFTDPTSEQLFPPTPSLVQPTNTYLLGIIGPSPSAP